MDKDRRTLIKSLRRHDISERVLDAMERVPRHLFVRDGAREYAYADRPLSIGEGQTISAPHMVGIMCDLMDLHDGIKILEIGAGSGYHAAVIAELIKPSGHIYTVERIPTLAEFAGKNLRAAGYSPFVTVHGGDGSLGWAEYAPYDGISVTCAAPDVPAALVEQLKVGGKLAIPVGRMWQELYLVERTEHGMDKRKVTSVAFVPLIGKYGFKD